MSYILFRELVDTILELYIIILFCASKNLIRIYKHFPFHIINPKIIIYMFNNTEKINSSQLSR